MENGGGFCLWQTGGVVDRTYVWDQLGLELGGKRQQAEEGYHVDLIWQGRISMGGLFR